jgi:glycine/D-amino acid oxidase-like deaminating enzyme
MDDWMIIVLALCGGVAGVFTLWYLIRKGYVKEVKGVLLYFVTQAEQLFGGKTGRLKRAAVLAWIYEKMPSALKLFISADAIGVLIDEAVEEMKKYLQSNGAAAAIVSGEDAGNGGE